MASRYSEVGALVAVLTLPVLLTAQAPQTPGRAQVEAMAQQTSERIRTLQHEADDLATRERTLLVELRRLEVERQLKTEELNQIGADLGKTERQLLDLDGRVRELDETVTAQRPGVRARLVALYKLGKPGYARLLLSVDDMRALGRASRMVATLANGDRQRISEHLRSLDGLRAARVALQERRDQAAHLRVEARRARLALDRAITEQARLIRAIDSKRDLNAQLLGELHAAQRHLHATLRQMAAGTHEDLLATPALPLRSMQGDLAWPVDGRVSTSFGRHRQTRFGTTIVRNGIEIAAAEEAPVRAAHAGQVAFADTFTGFGTLVILDHGNDAYSLYGYLATLAVQRGARVDRQDILGTVGRTPTGPTALYFELRVDGKPVDPLEWLRDR